MEINFIHSFPDIAKTAPGHSNNDSTLNASSGLLDNAGDSFKIVKKDKLDKYYQCPRCSKSFGNQDTLTKHGRFFHNISGMEIYFKSSKSSNQQKFLTASNAVLLLCSRVPHRGGAGEMVLAC